MGVLRDVQQEHGEWAEYNFKGKRSPVFSLLGMVEEMGEIAHGMLKMYQGIRGTKEEHLAAVKDGVGDELVYLVDFCNQMGIDAEEALQEVWSEVKQRDWVKYPKNGRTE